MEAEEIVRIVVYTDEGRPRFGEGQRVLLGSGMCYFLYLSYFFVDLCVGARSELNSTERFLTSVQQLETVRIHIQQASYTHTALYATYVRKKAATRNIYFTKKNKKTNKQNHSTPAPEIQVPR